MSASGVPSAGVTFTVADGELLAAPPFAVTKQPYVVPLTNPETGTGDVALLPVALPEPAIGLQVAVLEVIAPGLTTNEGEKKINACVSPATAAPMTGAPGVWARAFPAPRTSNKAIAGA